MVHKNTILYVVYGDNIFSMEAKYSLASAFAFERPGTDRFRYVVYAEHPETFGDLGIEVKPLNDEKIKEWRGVDGYLHLIKMRAHIDALQCFGGNVALIDTDTYFLKNPACLFSRIGPGRSVLHVKESLLSEVKEEKYHILSAKLQKSGLTNLAGEPLFFRRDEAMWNSGVVGLNEADGRLIAEAAHLVEQVRSDSLCSRIHNIEQFATGYFLSRKTKLSSSDDTVFHYWYHDLKNPFRRRLPVLMDPNSGGLVQKWRTSFYPERPRTSPLRKTKMIARIALRALGLRVPGIRGSI